MVQPYHQMDLNAFYATSTTARIAQLTMFVYLVMLITVNQSTILATCAGHLTVHIAPMVRVTDAGAAKMATS